MYVLFLGLFVCFFAFASSCMQSSLTYWSVVKKHMTFETIQSSVLDSKQPHTVNMLTTEV